MCAKSSKEKTCVRTSRCRSCGLKAKARLLAGPLFSIYFYFNEWSITKMPLWVEIFLSCKCFSLRSLRIAASVIGSFWGLTCDFWAENAEKKCNGKSDSNKSVAPPCGLRSGQSGSRFAAVLDARLKPRSTWLQRQRQGQRQTRNAGVSPLRRSKCVSGFGRNDDFLGGRRKDKQRQQQILRLRRRMTTRKATATTKTTADPPFGFAQGRLYGMTSNRTGNSKRNDVVGQWCAFDSPGGIE